jgi:hypothetical protein
MFSQLSLTPTKVGTADYFRLSLSNPPWHMNCLHDISRCKHPSEEHRENKEAHHALSLFDVVFVLVLCISEVTQILFLKRGVVKVEIYLIIADVLRSKVDTRWCHRYS